MSGAVTFPPSGPTSLTKTIPSYLYWSYNDDAALQSFVDSQNWLTGQLVDWFNNLNLPIYTGLSGPMLDWVAEGLYGISRPILSIATISNAQGPYGSVPYGFMPYGALNPSTNQAQYITVTDDLFKRIITWHIYRGDGYQYSTAWLKRRIHRFLNGPNGISPAVQDNTYDISVSYSGNTVDVVLPVGQISTAYQYCVADGVLALPFQYSYTITQLTPTSVPVHVTATVGRATLFGRTGSVTSGTTLPISVQALLGRLQLRNLVAGVSFSTEVLTLNAIPQQTVGQAVSLAGTFAGSQPGQLAWSNAGGPTTLTYSTPGTYSFSPLAAGLLLTITTWGSGSNSDLTSGGSGGACSVATYTTNSTDVSAGLSIAVGAGSPAGTEVSGTTNTAGGSSSVKNGSGTTICSAEGGHARTAGATQVLGGQAANGIGATRYSGGNADVNTGGGGAATPNGNGTQGTTGTSASSIGTGGAAGPGGAAAPATNVDGAAGISNPLGGSGGNQSWGGTGGQGGDPGGGAGQSGGGNTPRAGNGQVTISYTQSQTWTPLANLVVGPLATPQPSVLFTASGTWTCPTTGYYQLDGIGAGAGGGNGWATGGGGGAWARKNQLQITAGTVVTVNIGQGGAPGAAASGSGTYGSAGGDTSFVIGGTTVLLAKAGQAGGASGSLGGQASQCVGDLANSGGSSPPWSAGSGPSGGGGAGGPSGPGASGGNGQGAAGGEAGGGAADGGSAGANGTTSAGGAGGNNKVGTGGGAAGTSAVPNGGAGTAGAGGGGGYLTGNGGQGGSESLWSNAQGSSVGPGGGGGGAGGGSGTANVAGLGGNYGGGGGPGGWGGSNSAYAGAAGAQGVAAITPVTPGANAWSGQMPAFTAPATGVVIEIRDNSNLSLAPVSSNAFNVVSVAPPPPPPPSSMGPLAPSTTYPNYLAKPSASGVSGAGPCVFLCGPHIWNNFEQQVYVPNGWVWPVSGSPTWTGASTTTSLAFSNKNNVSDFLRWFQAVSGGNCIRCWLLGYGNDNDGLIGTNYMPFNLLSGSPSGNIYNGAKFDLTSYNTTLFNQWLADVQAAAAAGIYCQIMIHVPFGTGWGGTTGGYNNNAFFGANNAQPTCNVTNQTDIMQVTTGPSATSSTDTQYTQSGFAGTVWYWMTRYTAKWLDVMSQQPNVIWEIGGGENYASQATLTWMQAMQTFIQNYEKNNSYMQHPCLGGGCDSVSQGYGSFDFDPELITSSGTTLQVVAPTGYNGAPISGMNSSNAATNALAIATSVPRPVCYDTDHFAGQDPTNPADAGLTWFMRGWGIWEFMDECQGTGVANTPGSGPSLESYIDPPYGNIYHNNDGTTQSSAQQAQHQQTRTAMLAIQTAVGLLANSDPGPLNHYDVGNPQTDTSSTGYCKNDGASQYIVYTGYQGSASGFTLNLPTGSGAWNVTFIGAYTGATSTGPQVNA